jgi:flagellar basal-body rod protein FlgB
MPPIGAGNGRQMNLDKLPLFGLINRRMNWLTQRHTVLAQNVANADSPGYGPRDLTDQSFRRMLFGGPPRVTMAATSNTHLAAIRRSDEFRSDKTKDFYEAAPSGNAVILEEQLMKVSETQGAYRLATNLYSKHVSMLKQALGRDGR